MKQALTALHFILFLIKLLYSAELLDLQSLACYEHQPYCIIIRILLP